MGGFNSRLQPGYGGGGQQNVFLPRGVPAGPLQPGQYGGPPPGLMPLPGGVPAGPALNPMLKRQLMKRRR